MNRDQGPPTSPPSGDAEAFEAGLCTGYAHAALGQHDGVAAVLKDVLDRPGGR